MSFLTQNLEQYVSTTITLLLIYNIKNQTAQFQISFSYDHERRVYVILLICYKSLTMSITYNNYKVVCPSIHNFLVPPNLNAVLYELR